MEQIKELQSITRKEWIAYRWVEIPPTMGDSGEREFRVAGKRTPDESYVAMEQWDMTAEERDVETNPNIERNPDEE